MARLFALVSYAFPSVPLMGPWQTADRWIPWRALQALVAEIEFAVRLRRVVLTQGVGMGAAAALGEAKAQHAITADVEALEWQ